MILPWTPASGPVPRSLLRALVDRAQVPAAHGFVYGVQVCVCNPAMA